MKGNWSESGVTEHSKHCHGRFNWLFPKTLAILPNYHERKVREALEISFHQTKCEDEPSGLMLNRDSGVYTSANWKSLFQKMKEKY